MISVIQSPQLYSPAINENLFQIESDRAKLLYFNVQILSDVNDSILANQKYFVLPNYPTGTFFDLSSILVNLVESKIINTDNIIEDVPNLLMSYRLLISENFVDNGKVFQGDSLSVGSFKVWNAEISKLDFPVFKYKNYILNSTSSNTKFLTNKPLVNSTYVKQTEYLYFLTDGLDGKLVIKFYGKDNILKYSNSFNFSGSTSISKRITINSEVLNVFNILFNSKFGSNLDFSNSNYYTVQLKDNNNIPKSELRTFVFKSLKGCLNSFDLVFGNKLGGYDSVRLFNPKESISVEKTSINRYPFKIDSAGKVSELNNNVFNETVSVINSKSTVTYKAITDVLNDLNSKWMYRLFEAKEVYVKLENGYLVPVELTNTSYSIQLKKFSTNNNRVELEFKANVSGLFD